MMIISDELKPQIVAALMEQRGYFGGTDGQFAKQYGINASVFSLMKRRKGKDLNKLIRDGQWVNLARELDVALNERTWKVARTDVFTMIEEDINFCKQHSTSLMLCDDCGIGKTFSARYIARTTTNVFYIDARQCGKQKEFTKAIAKAIGVEYRGNLSDMRANIKYALRQMHTPVVIIDEAGALEEGATQMIIEMWNATENACGWYLMGADGLRAKMERNIRNQKVGWAELFSRFNERYNSVVPTERTEKMKFYRKLISDVISVNTEDKSCVNEITNRCLTNDSGRISGLRRAKTLLLSKGDAAIVTP